MAKLYFKYGSMNSGKSAYLLQAAHNYETSGETVLITKPSADSKSGQEVSSRLGISRKIDFITVPEMNLFTTFNNINQQFLQEQGKTIACLLVDEAQFLSKEQVNQCLKIATLLNIPVMCFGIRTDFKTEGFDGSDRLLQLAHSIEEMKTICSMCGSSKATLNGRKENGVFVSEGEKIAIDVNSDPKKRQKINIEYVNLCSSCYLKNLPIGGE